MTTTVSHRARPTCSLAREACGRSRPNCWPPTVTSLSDRFGVSVAVDGDTAVIGAIVSIMLTTVTHSGSAYVFTRTGSVWTEQAKLLASDGAGGDHFGESVAVDGDTAVIGAFTDDDNGSCSGSAYVFTRTGSVWTEQAKLLPADGAESGPLSAGACRARRRHGGHRRRTMMTTTVDSGSAYVFTRTAEVCGRSRPNCCLRRMRPSDQFGESVAARRRNRGHRRVP